MAAKPMPSGPGAFLGEELTIALSISEGSKISGQSHCLRPTNRSKDGLSDDIAVVSAPLPSVFPLVGKSVVRNALHFSLKVVAMAGPSEPSNCRFGTFVVLVPPVALYALKISLPSAHSSHWSQLSCLAALIVLK